MTELLKDEHKEITEESNTNFLYSFSVLSKEKNDALNTIYAFCRKTDDIVDNETFSDNEKIVTLSNWREKFKKAVSGTYEDSFFEKVDMVRKKFSIPVEPFLDLMDGMEMDITKKRYENFNELYEYCYRAAATVGLMCIEIFGYHKQKTKEFAVKLGIALQLTNIMRDVKDDATGGRIYIPQDEMKQFNYTEEMLLENKYNREFRDLMHYQYKRADKYYIEANKCLDREDRGLMVSAKIMEKIYYKLLNKIKSQSYDVLNYDVKVSKLSKAWIAFRTLYFYKFFYKAIDPRPEFQ